MYVNANWTTSGEYRPPRLQNVLDATRDSYLKDELDIDEFELAVEWLIRDGHDQDSIRMVIGGLPPARRSEFGMHIEPDGSVTISR
jgi:hypothetical protein